MHKSNYTKIYRFFPEGFFEIIHHGIMLVFFLWFGGVSATSITKDSLQQVVNTPQVSGKMFVKDGTFISNTKDITAEIVWQDPESTPNKAKINVSEKVEVNKQLATHKQEKQVSNPPKSDQKLIPFNKSSQDFLFGKDSFTISVTPTSQQFSKKHKSIYSHSENSTIFRLISLKTNVSTFVQLQKLNTYPSDFTSRPPPFS